MSSTIKNQDFAFTLKLNKEDLRASIFSAIQNVLEPQGYDLNSEINRFCSEEPEFECVALKDGQLHVSVRLTAYKEAPADAEASA